MGKNDGLRMIGITGGGGYIGRHICEKLIKDKKDILIMDDLSNCEISIIKKLQKMANATGTKILFEKGDIRNETYCKRLIRECDTVIHLAALKSAMFN